MTATKELRIGGEYVVEMRRHQSKPNLVACRVLGGAEIILDGERLAEMLRADWATDADTDPYEKDVEDSWSARIALGVASIAAFLAIGVAYCIRTGLI